ncbi:Protein of unknown function [Gryllus bimaculatus]|nr:Protein of unknown function [Gryllus bimaculatus]
MEDDGQRLWGTVSAAPGEERASPNGRKVWELKIKRLMRRAACSGALKLVGSMLARKLLYSSSLNFGITCSSLLTNTELPNSSADFVLRF